MRQFLASGWKISLRIRYYSFIRICVCTCILDECIILIGILQIHKLLKGLPPIRSLVAVGTSAAKLVSLPVKNYKKDRRIVKGMQRGNECIKTNSVLSFS